MSSWDIQSPFCEMLQCVLDSKFGRRRLLAMSAAISQLKIPNIDISGVAFPPALRAKLLKGGFKMTADFDGMSPSELSRGAAHLAFLLCAKLRNLECEEPIFPNTTSCLCMCLWCFGPNGRRGANWNARCGRSPSLSPGRSEASAQSWQIGA